MYDIKDKTFNIDDFLEIKISKFELFWRYLKYFIENDLISEIRIIIVDDNNLYNKSYKKGINDNYLNIELDYLVSKDNINLEYRQNFAGFWFSNNDNYNDNYRKYDLFTKGHYSLKETLILEWCDYSEIKENYHIHFIYKWDIDKINNYLQEYLLLWWSEKLKKESNYIKPSKQIWDFGSYLINYLNNYWDEFIYYIWTNIELDEVTLVLYFNITWYIELLEFDDWVSRVWLNNININFKIKVLQKFYDDFTKKEEKIIIEKDNQEIKINLEKKIKKLDKTEIINKNGIIFYSDFINIQVKDKLHKLDDLLKVDSNFKNWIVLLFTILKEWPKRDINDYLSQFIKYKKDYFNWRNKNVKNLNNAKSRLNWLWKNLWFKLMKNENDLFDISLI
jgi:hypothetical protein